MMQMGLLLTVSFEAQRACCAKPPSALGKCPAVLAGLSTCRKVKGGVEREQSVPLEGENVLSGSIK